MSARASEGFSSWGDVVARREWEVGFAMERLERMEPVDLPLCRMERASADVADRSVRIGLKRGKLLYLFKHPAADVERDKHRNVITRARFIKQRLEAHGYRLIPWDFKKGQPPRFWDDRPMDDDDDDLYGPAEPRQPDGPAAPTHDDGDDSADEPMEEESPDDDSDDSDDSDSDLEIIIDKPAVAPKPAHQQQQQPPESKAIKIEAPPQASAAPSHAARTAAPQLPAQPGTAYPAIKSSTVDVDSDPVYPPVGKPISHVDMDADLAEETKPWRLPGADQSDFFNYGFDEFTWEQYRSKQQIMTDTSAEYAAQRQQMVAMINGPPPTGPAGMPGMPGEAEMMQMMQQMAASGMDPNSMDFNQMMMQMSNPAAMAGFGGPTGNQGGFGGGHGGGGGGRGRGRGRGNW